MGLACPTCVDVCIWMKDGSEVFPLTRITDNARSRLADKVRLREKTKGEAAITHRYIGQPSASSRNLNLSNIRFSGPLFRTTLTGRESAGRV